MATEATMKADSLEVEDLQKVMKTPLQKQLWSEKSRQAMNTRQVKREFQLLVVPGKGNMTCHQCQIKGHKAIHKFSGNCNVCGNKAAKEKPIGITQRPKTSIQVGTKNNHRGNCCCSGS